MSKVTLAPADGGAEDTIEMFQTKYRKANSSQMEAENWEEATEDGQMFTRGGQRSCILPSNWKDRIDKDHKPSKVYRYSKIEILEYNEIQYILGPKAAKEWADRRCHERNN